MSLFFLCCATSSIPWIVTTYSNDSINCTGRLRNRAIPKTTRSYNRVIGVAMCSNYSCCDNNWHAGRQPVGNYFFPDQNSAAAARRRTLGQNAKECKVTSRCCLILEEILMVRLIVSKKAKYLTNYQYSMVWKPMSIKTTSSLRFLYIFGGSGILCGGGCIR